MVGIWSHFQNPPTLNKKKWCRPFSRAAFRFSKTGTSQIWASKWPILQKSWILKKASKSLSNWTPRPNLDGINHPNISGTFLFSLILGTHVTRFKGRKASSSAPSPPARFHKFWTSGWPEITAEACTIFCFLIKKYAPKPNLIGIWLLFSNSSKIKKKMVQALFPCSVPVFEKLTWQGKTACTIFLLNFGGFQKWFQIPMKLDSAAKFGLNKSSEYLWDFFISRILACFLENIGQIWPNSNVADLGASNRPILQKSWNLKKPSKSLSNQTFAQIFDFFV